MGKGFDTFMENPHWKRCYENAPSDEVRKYYKLAWESSPFVLSEAEIAQIDKYISTEMSKLKLTISDYEYLAANAVGSSKMAFKKKIEKLKSAK